MVCGGGSKSVAVDMPDTAMSSGDSAAVDAAMTKVWEENKSNMPALYVGVWDPEKGVFTKAYGEAAPGVAATLDDSLRIGSISKSYTANVILQLVDDGTLSLNDTISDAAPEVAKKRPTPAPRPPTTARTRGSTQLRLIAAQMEPVSRRVFSIPRPRSSGDRASVS